MRTILTRRDETRRNSATRKDRNRRAVVTIKIPLHDPKVSDEAIDAADSALRNEHFVMGESVYKFEEEFAKYCGTDFAASVGSGSFAIQLSLIAAGLRTREEVYTTPMTFIATASSIVHAGGSPLFGDIDPNDYVLVPRKTVRVAVPVDLYGYPIDARSFAEHFDIVVEDACQAHGAERDGRKAGSASTIGCFSFYSTKNLTVCGDGGMVISNDEEVVSKVRMLRDCGRVSRYIHKTLGFTSRLNTVNAAIGLVHLSQLDKENEGRRRVARSYFENLRDLKGIQLPPGESSTVKPAYHLFVIKARQRDRLHRWLRNRGIQTEIHYPIPVHLQPAFRRFGHRRGIAPLAEEHSRKTLSLPIYPHLDNTEVRFIAESIRSFYEGEGK